jgi:ubiquinone/menaquinone biosynthesis C-methylase UbiE
LYFLLRTVTHTIAKDLFMFARLVARQLRRPGRFLGFFIANMMERNNQKAIDWTIALTGIQPTDHVLELGVGPGAGIAGAAALASRGHVSGIDYSPAMVARATRRNKALIASGRADIGHGTADAIPFADNTFDRAFGVNIIYFWPTPKRELTEIRRVLKPGATVVLFLSDKESMKSIPATQTPEFHAYTGEEFAAIVRCAEFATVRVETLTVQREGLPFTMHCVIAVK